jgi:hypothetical protein
MRSDKISFISTIEGLESIEECLPKPAKHFIPEWFKNTPIEIGESGVTLKTVKACPSFPDFFSQGYVIPMWADTILQYNKINDEWAWKTSTNSALWEMHPKSQLLDHTDVSFNGAEAHFTFKAICPWKIITPPGWSVLQLPLFYHFNQDWSVLPGIIDTDIHAQINQQVLYHSDKEEIKINRGDPFALYIPFKRSDRLKHEVRYQTEKDKKTLKKQHTNMSTKFDMTGFYRKLQRERDKNF